MSVSALSICLYWVSRLVCSVSDQYAPEKVQKILVGNKSDEEQKRQVATEQGNKVNKIFPPCALHFHSCCYLLSCDKPYFLIFFFAPACQGLWNGLFWDKCLYQPQHYWGAILYFFFSYISCFFLNIRGMVKPCKCILTANQVFDLSFITVFHPIGWISLTS